MPQKPNAVVLTYHRLPDAKMANPKFHDLPFDRLPILSAEEADELALAPAPAAVPLETLLDAAVLLGSSILRHRPSK